MTQKTNHKVQSQVQHVHDSSLETSFACDYPMQLEIAVVLAKLLRCTRKMKNADAHEQVFSTNDYSLAADDRWLEYSDDRKLF